MALTPNATSEGAEATTTSEMSEMSEPPRYYSTLLSTDLAMPQWEALLTVSVLSTMIVTTVVGNVLVIVSVFTHAPLKITPNYFIVSLAAADLTVSILVLPLNVLYQVQLVY